MTISQMRERIQIIFLLISVIISHITNAQVYRPNALLNGFAHADTNVLDAMLPHRSYFIEFPDIGYFLPPKVQPPMCGDRTNFSFLFRKGSKEHYRKLIVELEGGPACWGGRCTCGRLQVPWYDYAKAYNDTDDQALPRLGSCNGVVDGFASELATSLFDNTTASDLPLMHRGDSSSDQPWWDKIAKDGSSLKDWSYILIPHCTMDWHLGSARNIHLTQCINKGNEMEMVWHRGASNRDAVLAWVVRQFGDEQISLREYYQSPTTLSGTGLDGLVMVTGGKIGGCERANPQAASSSVAAAIFAYNAASYFKTMQSAMVLVEGASLFNFGLPSSDELQFVFEAGDLPFHNLPYDMKLFVEQAPPSVHFVWVSSNGLSETLEQKLLEDMQQAKADNFHLFTPSTNISSTFGSCPTYAFPNDDQAFGTFLEQVVEQLSWTSYDIVVNQPSPSSSSSNRESLTVDELLGLDETGETNEVTIRLSWLAIAVIILGSVAIMYLFYFMLRCIQWTRNKPSPMGPYQLWLYGLTHYPLCFLSVSVAIPCWLSWLAVSRAGYTVNVNLDFQSYLAISSDISTVSNNYDSAVKYQETTDREADLMCRVLGDWALFRPEEGRRSLAWMENQTSEVVQSANISRRHLQGGDIESAGSVYRTTLQIFYQNPQGGNVFTPIVLEEMRRFEADLREYPYYGQYCRRLFNLNCRIGSSLQWLYVDGNLVDDIEGALAEKATPEKVDQYFNVPYNLASNMTRSYFYFEGEKASVNRFLKELYEEFLKKSDQENKYPNVVFTWENGFLLQQEANEALLHDTLWSVGSLAVIGLMIYLKVQDLFVFFFGMLGLILAFSASYYWCTAHFGIPEITLLHVSGLFVMLGIGADDVFLMVDSYEHAKVALAEGEREPTENRGDDASAVESSADPDQTMDRRETDRVERIRKQMLWAYSTAGGMMLVSSMTAAVCFFSNAFGVLLVIQDFGIFMGMVVLINFFHVMTILPSAILVKEIYIKRCCCPSASTADGDGARARNIPSHNNGSQRGNRDHDVEANHNSRSSQEGPRNENRNENYTEGDVPSSDLGLMDRILFKGYAPFLVRRRLPILVLSILFAVIIGSVGLANLEFTDGSIVIFTNEYNQGRLSSIKNDYYSHVDPSNLSLGSIGSGGIPGIGGSSGGGSLGGGSNGGSGGITDGIPDNWGDGGTGGGGSVVGGGTTGGTGNSGGGSGTGSNGGGTGSNSGNTGASPTDNVGNGGTNSGGGTPAISPTKSPSAPSSEPATNTGNQNTIAEETSVQLLWGINTRNTDGIGPWRVKSSMKKFVEDEKSLLAGVSGFDVTEPASQQWMLDVVLAARANFALDAISSEPTWIEMLAEFAAKQDHGFPIPKELFLQYVEILKFKDPTFEELVKDEIGTSLPGLAGEPLYASVTFQARGSSSLGSFNKWRSFADSTNEKTPKGIPPMVAKSDLFWNSARAQETIDATVNTWLLANLLCFAIILLFTQNLILCLMVVGTIILMFMCIAGWLFAVLDRTLGPVQALGVSIFIGLSANYSLHVVHAYHRSTSTNRVSKVKQAVFITGSPICASAISTIGGCVFLFGCRAVPLVELGILICCVTAMALLYSMGFLLAWLLVMGPLPCSDSSDSAGRQLHRGDIYWLCHKTSQLCFAIRSSTTESRSRSVQQMRSSASSLVSSVKTKCEGKLSKKSTIEDTTKKTDRDNTKSIPTFPSSASSASHENSPIQRDSPKNMSHERTGEEALAEKVGSAFESPIILPTPNESSENEAVRQPQVNAPGEDGNSTKLYSRNENLEAVPGHRTNELTSLEQMRAQSVSSRVSKPVVNKMLVPKDGEMLDPNEDIPTSSTQMNSNSNDMSLEDTSANIDKLPKKEEDSNDNWDLSSIMSYMSGTDRVEIPVAQPASILVLGSQDDTNIEALPSKEEDANDNWDLSSIMSYISGTSGTDRAETTLAQPASMLVLGPQDDQSVASELELDTLMHVPNILPSSLDDSAIPFDENDSSMPFFDEM